MNGEGPTQSNIASFWNMGVDSSRYLGKFHHDLTSRPSPGIMVFIGKSSPNARKIQVSELLWFTQINPGMIINMSLTLPSILGKPPSGHSMEYDQWKSMEISWDIVRIIMEIWIMEFWYMSYYSRNISWNVWPYDQISYEVGWWYDHVYDTFFLYT